RCFANTPVRFDGRSLTVRNPFVVKLDFRIDQSKGFGPASDRFSHACLVCAQQGAALLQCGAALFHEGRVLAHLSNRHPRISQPVHEIEPTDVVLTVHPSTALIPDDAGNEPLGLVPADRVNATSGPFRDLAYSKSVRHTFSLHADSH